MALIACDGPQPCRIWSAKCAAMTRKHITKSLALQSVDREGVSLSTQLPNITHAPLKASFLLGRSLLCGRFCNTASGMVEVPEEAQRDHFFVYYSSVLFIHMHHGRYFGVDEAWKSRLHICTSMNRVLALTDAWLIELIDVYMIWFMVDFYDPGGVSSRHIVVPIGSSVTRATTIRVSRTEQPYVIGGGTSVTINNSYQERCSNF